MEKRQDSNPLLEADECDPHGLSILILADGPDVEHLVQIGKEMQKHFNHHVRLAASEVYKPLVEQNELEFFPLTVSGAKEANSESTTTAYEGWVAAVKNLYSQSGKGEPGSLRFGPLMQSKNSFGAFLKASWAAACTPWVLKEDTKDTLLSPQRAKDVSEPVKPKGKSSSAVKVKPDAIIASPVCAAHVHIAEKLDIPVHIMGSLPWLPTKLFRHPCQTRALPPPGGSANTPRARMVINDAKVLKEGYLEKKRKLTMSSLLGFRLQYFWILDMHGSEGKEDASRYWLAYDEDKDNLAPEQVVSLSGLKVKLLATKYAFKLTTPKRTYVLRAKSEEETASWLKAFNALEVKTELLPPPTTRDRRMTKKFAASIMDMIRESQNSDKREEKVIKLLNSEGIGIEIQSPRDNLASPKTPGTRDSETTPQESYAKLLGSQPKRRIPFTEREDVKIILQGWIDKRRKGILRWQYHTQYFWLLKKTNAEQMDRKTSDETKVEKDEQKLSSKGKFSWANAGDDSKGNEFEYFLAYDSSQKTIRPLHVIPLTSNLSVDAMPNCETFVLGTSKRTYHLKVSSRGRNKHNTLANRMDARKRWIQELQNIAKACGASTPRARTPRSAFRAPTPRKKIILKSPESSRQNNSTSEISSLGKIPSPSPSPSPISNTSPPPVRPTAVSSDETTPRSKSDTGPSTRSGSTQNPPRKGRKKIRRTKSGLPAHLLAEMKKDKDPEQTPPTALETASLKTPRKLTVSKPKPDIESSSLKSGGRRKAPSSALALKGRKQKNTYFDNFIMLKEGYLERKTSKMFSRNEYKRTYVMVYKTALDDSNEDATEDFFLGTGPGPTLNKPKHVSPLVRIRLEHNFIKGYMRLTTSKEEFKFRAASEEEEAAWTAVFSKVTKFSTRVRQNMDYTPSVSVDRKVSQSGSPVNSRAPSTTAASQERPSMASLINIDIVDDSTILFGSPTAAEAQLNIRSHLTYNKDIAKILFNDINHFRTNVLKLQPIATEEKMADAITGKGIPSSGLWDPGLIPDSGEWSAIFRAVGFGSVLNPAAEKFSRDAREEIRDWLTISAEPVLIVLPDSDQLSELENGHVSEVLTEAAVEAKVRLLTLSSRPIGSKTRKRRRNAFFEDIFETERGKSLLMEFLMKEMSAENLIFLEAVSKWENEYDKGLLGSLWSKAREIYNKFLKANAPQALNLPEKIRTRIKERLDAAPKQPLSRTLFGEASEGIMELMQSDSVLRFRRTNEYRELMRELHGSEEDFIIRDVDPREVEIKWLLGRPQVKGSICFGSSSLVWRSFATGRPALLLTRNPIDSFWARTLLPTRAVIGVPTRNIKTSHTVWAIKELVKEDTLKRAADVSQALSRDTLFHSRIDAIRSFHDGLLYEAEWTL